MSYKIGHRFWGLDPAKLANSKLLLWLTIIWTHLVWKTLYSRHGLKDGLNTIAKGELVNYFLFSLAKIDFPSVLTNSLRQLDIATVLIADIVEQILMETCILDVIGRHLAEKANIKFWFSFDKVCMHHQVRHSNVNVSAEFIKTQKLWHRTQIFPFSFLCDFVKKNKSKLCFWWFLRFLCFCVFFIFVITF